jgi:hypothetical protein
LVISRRSRPGAVLALALAAAACGRSVRSQPAPTTAAAGAAGRGGMAGSGGTGGAAAGQAGTTSGAGAGVTVPEEKPLSVRHASVGFPVPPSCFTSLVPTANGMAFGSVGNNLALSGTITPDPTYGFRSSVETLPDSAKYVLVVGDESGEVVAWSSRSDDGLTIRRLDAAGTTIDEIKTTYRGDPVAGLGSSTELTLLLAGTDGVSLLTYADGTSGVVEVEPEGCISASSVALGRLEGDVVVGYLCNRFATTTNPERNHLVVARVDGATGAVERTVVDAELGGSANTYSGPGLPGVTWTGDEFLFAYLTPTGETVLGRVTPGDPEPRVTTISGLPDAAIHVGDLNPSFSVLEVGDQIALTRSICNGHEDASPTGPVAICRVSRAGVAECTQAEAPCWDARLVAVGSNVELCACGGRNAPSIMPLDLSALPTDDGIFPTASAHDEPLALDCHGDDCSVLMRIDSTQATTGYDTRLAFQDLTLADGCDVTTCSAGLLEPAGLYSATTEYYFPNLTLERQSKGFPQGVVTVQRDGIDAVPTLALLGPDGVGWAQPVPSPDASIFAWGEGFVGLWYDLLGGVYQLSADANGVVSDQAVHLPQGPRLPSAALCGDRILVHSFAQGTSLDPPMAGIYAVDPATFAVSKVFDPGYFPAKDSSSPAMPLGCAGDWLVLLDGARVHRYTLDGTRAPDIELLAPVSLAQVESRGDHVLILSALSDVDGLDALFLFADGSTRSFRLPLPPGSAPLTSLTVASDRGDRWLRVLYSVAKGGLYSGSLGAVYVSAFELPP